MLIHNSSAISLSDAPRASSLSYLPPVFHQDPVSAGFLDRLLSYFDTVFAEACEKAYEPFFDVLEKHPSVKTTQHWSGPLLEWIVRHRPELIERITGS